MKKRLCNLVIFMIITFVLCSCSQKPSQEVENNESNSTDAQQENSNASMEDINKAMDAVGKNGWPKEQVPAGLPEYTKGNIVNSGDAGDAYYIKINETDKSSLSEYLDALRNSGWIVSESDDYTEAVKDVHSIEFTWQDGENMLQMAIHSEEMGVWPTNEIPPDVIMPENAVLIGEVSVIEAEEGRAWYFDYICDGLDEEAAQQYFRLLLDKGWSGDDYMVYKEFEWNGKKYTADIQIYETVENRTTFTCNFSIVD